VDLRRRYRNSLNEWMSQQTEDADEGIGKGKNSPLQFYKSLAGASIVRVEYYA